MIRSARAEQSTGYDGVLKQDGAGLAVVMVPSFLLHLPLFIVIFGGFGVGDARNPLIDKDAYMVSAVVLPKAEGLPDKAAAPTMPEREVVADEPPPVPDEMVLRESKEEPTPKPELEPERTPAPEPPPKDPPKRSVKDLLASVQADEASKKVRFATDPDGSEDADPLDSLRAKFGKQRDPYDQLVYERIRSNWQVPSGKAMETFIRFTVDPSGRLSAPETVRPSGDWIYDQRCLRAVTRTGTVPPPPGGKPRVVTIRCYPDG